MAFDLNNFVIDRVRRGTMFSPETGEVLWSITQIKDASLSMTSESADVTDAIGSVIMFGKDRPLQEPEKQMVVTAAGFLGSQMEQ